MQTCTLSEKAYWLMDFATKQYDVDMNTRNIDWKNTPSAVVSALYRLIVEFYI